MATFTRTINPTPGGNTVVITITANTGKATVGDRKVNTHTIGAQINGASGGTLTGVYTQDIEATANRLQNDTVALADGTVFSLQIDADLVNYGYVKS